MDNSNVLGCLVGIAILLAFAGLVYWIVRRERARKESERSVLSSLGFVEVAQPDMAIFARLEALHRRSPNQRFTLRALYEKRALSGRFLVFDLIETSGDDTTYLGSNAIAVQSPGLCLPRSYIAGRMALEGKTAAWMVGMAEKVIDWAARQSSLRRLDYEDTPEIDGKLIVMVEDAAAFRDYFTDDRLKRLTWLSEMERLSGIECDGDIFILQRQASPARASLEKNIYDLLRDAQLAWNTLG